MATAIGAAFLGMSARTVIGQQAVGGFVISGASEQRISALETRFSGGVTLQRGNITVVADDVTFLVDRDLLVATGKVVFRQGGNTINSERATFDAGTQFGTFIRAYGVFAIKAVTPLYFYGETVEQTDSKSYRVTNGGFTSSTEPTPSWQAKSAAMTFDVE